MHLTEQDNLSEKKHSLFTWFLLAFLVGLGLRLWGLNGMHFTQGEAQIAQSAWQIAMGEAAGVPGNMSYAGLSALLFHLFEPSFFFARLAPVLLGSSLILIPWFWREELGEKTAIVLAFGLALDPILLSFSRQIVTPIFVLAGIGWAFTALKNKLPVLAGSMFGLAFLGGYSFWVLALVGISVFVIRRKNANFQFIDESYKRKAFLLPLLTSFLISLVLLSSAFLLSTEGLGGIGAGAIEFIHLFRESYEILAYQPIMIAIAYSILPLFFAIWVLVDDFRSKRALRTQLYLLGWGVSVLLSLVLGRQDLGLLVFAAVFAWLGAAEKLSQIIEQAPKRHEVVFWVTLFQVVILVYIQVVSGKLTSPGLNAQDYRLALLALAAGILLLVISTILVGLGWMREVSWQAIQNSLLIMLIALTLGLSLRSVGSRQEDNSLSFLAGPILLPNDDIEIVIDEIDRAGRVDRTEITYALGDLEQQFSWFFREQVNREDTFNVLQTDLALSKSENEFSVTDSYRGRNVVLFRQIDQQVVKPGDFLKTLLGEPLPLVSQNGVLWVRLNLFTGAN